MMRVRGWRNDGKLYVNCVPWGLLGYGLGLRLWVLGFQERSSKGTKVG